MILNDRQLEELIQNLRQQQKCLIVTSGCFDQLHHGHFSYLKEAKELGDYLLVLLNSDSSVTHLKGIGRPLNCERVRAEDLSELKSVDGVYIFDALTPVQILEVIKPDYFVKGGDYERLEIPEERVVNSYGGQLVFLDFLNPSYTVSNIKFFTK